MTNQQPAELSQPSVGPPPQSSGACIVGACVRPRTADVGCSPDRARSVRSRGGAGARTADRNRSRDRQSPVLVLSRAAFGLRNPDLGERGFRKRNFTGRGTFQPNSQRKTFTVDQYHPLRALAPLGFSDRRAPLFCREAAVEKGLVPFQQTPLVNAPSSVRQACSHTPSVSQCWSRRQHVEGDGNSSGRKRHAAPVCRIHKISSKQARLGAGGRPRQSGRCLGGGSKAPTNSHCSSVNSFCRPHDRSSPPNLPHT